jgi:two-component system OmpR family response regulator
MPPERDPSPGASAIEAAAARSGRRVLVIDDDAQVRHLLCEYLDLLGFLVHPAADGTEGLALFAERPYDLVITDLMMPDMTGWDVVRAIRARAGTVPVIMVTGSVDNLETRRVRESGLTVVPKPFSLQDLEAAIASVAPAAAGAPRSGSAPAPSGSDPAALDTTDVVRALRSTLDAARTVVATLDATVQTVERLVRAHESALEARARLQDEKSAAMVAHEETLRDLARLRDQHEVVNQERRRATEELTAILHRLRP